MMAVVGHRAGDPVGVHAYTDESGNTGLDIFNTAQPIFYTLTALAKEDLNAAAAGPVAAWCAELGVSELHAAELRIQRLARIAAEMRELVDKHQLRFIATIVEKRHMAAMKFADTVLDAGLNPAVVPAYYAIRPMRLRMALDLAKHMKSRSERMFWDAYRDQDLAKFKEVVDRVESSVSMYMTDARGRELLGDALRWASAHPGDLLPKRSKLDSPNLVAFSFVVQGCHEVLLASGLKVTTFVHDEQNEFMRAFKEMYEVVHRVRMGDDVALMPDFAEASTFTCPLTESTSASAPALQLVDVLLWLLKRFLRDGSTGNTDCDDLLVPVLEGSLVQQFSRQQLMESVMDETQKVFSSMRAFTPKIVANAVKLRDQMEAARQSAMLASDEQV